MRQLVAEADVDAPARPRDTLSEEQLLARRALSDVLVEEGVTDFDAYANAPGTTPQVDLFVDHV